MSYKNYKSESPLQRAWRKLRKHTTAMIGLGIILTALFIALFGYLVVPDPSQFANRQIIELKLKEPGYKATLLKIKLERVPEQRNIFLRMWKGSEVAYRYIPLLNYEILEDKVFLERYIGHSEQGLKEEYTFSEIMHGSEGVGLEISSAEAREKIESNFIVEKQFLLGTDAMGRDYFSRLLLGTRVSLAVGFMAVMISLFIGMFLGAMAGYFRGWMDDAIMYIINVFWSVPTLLLALSLALVLEKGLWQVFVAIGLTMWIELARVVRGQILVVREMEYVEAARSLGFGHFRTVTRHILPNIVGPVIVIIASNFAAAILIEAGLSFLGLGVERPMPSWGMMLSDNRTYLVAGLAHLALIPGIAICLLVLSFFMLGNGLRDAFDVKS